MSLHITHPVFDGFQTLWVFNPKKQFPLGNHELLVYSALAHAVARELRLKNTDLAWRTGLSRNSIPRILQNLFKEGFILEDRTPVERLECFLSAERKQAAPHWSKDLRFWKCLIRSQNSKLLVSDQCVLSYVWWSQITGFEPAHGWSVPYLAFILKLGKKTVRDALGRLKKMCLMQMSDSQWCIPESLSVLQEEWFIRKSAEATAKKKVTLGTFEPDIRELADGYLPGDFLEVTEAEESLFELSDLDTLRDLEAADVI